jgi:cell division protease FtsH
MFTVSQRRGPFRYWPISLALVAVTLIALIAWRATRPDVVTNPLVPYSDLAAALSEHQISDLVVQDGGAKIVATLRSPRVIDGEPVSKLEAQVPSRAVSLEDLERWSATGTEVRVVQTANGPSTEVVIQLASLFAIIGIVAFFVIHQRGGIRASKFVASPQSRQLTLADVGGVREAQADLRDVIAYLRNPKRYEAMGAKCPRGVLLIGPPGTGKTLLARAVAGEAGCSVLVAAGSDFNEMYVGVGSRRVRQLAKQAREQAP